MLPLGESWERRKPRLDQLAMSREANWQFMLATNCIGSCSCHTIQVLRSNVETCTSRIQQLHDMTMMAAPASKWSHGMLSAALQLRIGNQITQLHCRTSSSSRSSSSPCQTIGLGTQCVELPDKALEPIRATPSVSCSLRDFSAGLKGHAPGRFGHAGRL
jgi:hypothetical protein